MKRHTTPISPPPASRSGQGSGMRADTCGVCRGGSNWKPSRLKTLVPVPSPGRERDARNRSCYSRTTALPGRRLRNINPGAGTRVRPMSKLPTRTDPDRLPASPEFQPAEIPAPSRGRLPRLLEAAGPAALPFLRDWPRDLIARPLAPRSLPVVSALEGLSRYAAPETRTLVEAVAALAGDLDWRQTYSSADFGERFLQNYGWSEWIGQRGVFESDAIACGVLLLGPDIEYPAHSHEAEELYLPLAGHAWWRSAQLRLAASRAGRMDPSSLLDDPRHAHRSRASARGLCLARRRPHGEVARRMTNSVIRDEQGMGSSSSATPPAIFFSCGRG